MAESSKNQKRGVKVEELDPNRKGRFPGSIVIEPFRQITFGLYIIIICVGFMLVAGSLFIISFVEQYRHMLNLFNVVDASLRWDFIIDDVFYANAKRIALCFAVFLIVMFYTVFKLTHRYYGPLVSIHRFLKEIENENYAARVTIRKNDELQDLVVDLNNLAESLEKKYSSKPSVPKED